MPRPALANVGSSAQQQKESSERSKAWRKAPQHSQKHIEAMVKPTDDAGPLRKRGQRRYGAGDSRGRRAIIERPDCNRHWPRARSSPRSQHAASLEEAAATAPRRTKTARETTQGATVTSTKSLHEAHELPQQASSPPHTSDYHRSLRSNFQCRNTIHKNPPISIREYMYHFLDDSFGAGQSPLGLA